MRFLMCFVLVACAFVAGCSSSATPSADGTQAGSSGEKIKICLLPKIKGITYFSSCADGAREAANELGDVELIYDGPTDGDARKQAEMIENWTVDGVDVICVSPNAPDVIASALKEAQDRMLESFMSEQAKTAANKVDVPIIGRLD